MFGVAHWSHPYLLLMRRFRVLVNHGLIHCREEKKAHDLPTKRTKREPNIIYNDGDAGTQVINTLQSKLAARQQRGRKVNDSELTNEQRKIEFLAKLNDPSFSRE